jgi:hypothetical protein
MMWVGRAATCGAGADVGRVLLMPMRALPRQPVLLAMWVGPRAPLLTAQDALPVILAHGSLRLRCRALLCLAEMTLASAAAAEEEDDAHAEQWGGGGGLLAAGSGRREGSAAQGPLGPLPSAGRLARCYGQLTRLLEAAAEVSLGGVG